VTSNFDLWPWSSNVTKKMASWTNVPKYLDHNHHISFRSTVIVTYRHTHNPTDCYTRPLNVDGKDKVGFVKSYIHHMLRSQQYGSTATNTFVNTNCCSIYQQGFIQTPFWGWGSSEFPKVTNPPIKITSMDNWAPQHRNMQSSVSTIWLSHSWLIPNLSHFSHALLFGLSFIFWCVGLLFISMI